ncbi:vacuolar protein sorting-associated protein 8 homolog isoform X1 [Tribolium castaneum]|uniref:Vacuolar protein sorting-associated protein 8 homolog-like Protein n=1 Tax=Tribolium castaneum TaxID=7070 RepID=D6WDQ0_TRICA|nr:PREDICTED: vacuolar protein sorting-associated protein 8 homolog [Tribolium castaneum]XP_008191125.1 PREDICTED: vacuolar protein sorting-associated protein 8 homolog [Tribolium castaneum]EFA00812.1 Vacuolar protein sorting-associated protein 8 homolog-like Protein [Tribolium castaneum]|eukprot:XP_008191123.1 PREDICTED: vacuolar protein sorting-associated protein 8 homolog [Tribolium castaneum]
MGSESEEVLVEDSDDSLLDIRELNDLEFDIPSVAAPSLESVLWDMESEEGSDSASLHSFQSLTSKFRSMLCHRILQGVSTQVASAGERVGAGLPTVITNSLKYVAIGTSHGYVLNFDSEQNLCWCCYDTNSSDQGAVSALAFNLDSTRLLIGYERGFISMVDATSGDIIRKLPDAHAPQTAVLHLRFTFLNNLALCGDSSGCVFSLSFNRRLGVRSWDSKCLFSGARGEVCVFEPLVQGHDIHFLSHHILVAMATLSKVIVISIRPRLKVLFSQPLPRVSTSLPLISWQLVSVGRTFQPVLAWGRCNELNYTRVVFHSTNNNRLRLLPLRNVQLNYTLTAMHWLGTRHLALLDTSENLRLVEVRTQRELEVLELASAGLVYSSAHFKALAVGGGVSEAFALAGERACYNSLSSRGDQLLVLGTKAVHLIKLRTWPERLLYLSEQGRWAEALNLAAEEGMNREIFTSSLLKKYLENLNQNTVDKDSLTAAVNCCVKLNKTDILCNELLEAVSSDQSNQDWYYTLLTDHINNGLLTSMSPQVAQTLVDYLEKKDAKVLENVLLSLDITCLDLHQALSICKKRKLYDAWIHITTKTIGDYASPLTEFLAELTPDNHRLGNTILVYVSSCLAGLGYPSGHIPEKDVPRAKHEVLRCLETVHSMKGSENEPSYPYLRALLKYNTRECLNVVGLAFTEAEFSGEMGLLQRQRLVQILTKIVIPPEFSASQIINLACFIVRLVTSNNLNIDEAMLDTVIKSLTDFVDQPLSLRDHSEREQAWLDLLNAGKLKFLSNKDLLHLALESKCYRVAEHLYEVLNDYSNILVCYLRDPVRKSDVFNYILNYITDAERSVEEQFVVNFRDLVATDSKKTSEVVVEHFPELIVQLSEIVDSAPDLQYAFLKGVVSSDIKLPSELAEKYLELLCLKNPQEVCSYVQLSSCRIDKALAITKKHEVHAATALLLEQGGEWTDALQLLLQHDMVDEAVNLCIRGAEHLDSDGAQKLWLALLQHNKSTRTMSLRQLLHAAAPHVLPAQLLNLVSNASFGDVKVLLQGMLIDYVHDVQMFSTTLKLLSRDLHHELAKSLCSNSRGISVTNVGCKLCQKPLVFRQELGGEQSIAVWGCGHCFHVTCLKVIENDTACPQCRMQASQVPATQPVKKYTVETKTHARPDLEGHF